MQESEAIDKGLYNIISTKMDELYLEAMKEQIIYHEIIKKMADEIKIVYTPLHGSGNIPVQDVLKELGFKNVYIVKEQQEPDGNFPTVPYPNPEEPEAFKMALSLAKEVEADIVLATDPDADRLGVYALDNKTGEYISFTGNMSGLLIAEYLLKERKLMGTLPINAAVVKTIVTTNMTEKITNKYNVELFEVLTGFKFIGEKIKEFEDKKSNEFIFGLEEGYGCLAGTYARDKDACVAVMLLCEVPAYYKNKGMSLWDGMLGLYEEFGYYKESLQTITLKGIEGSIKIKDMMEDMRNNTPKEIGGLKITGVRDYLMDTRKDLSDNTITSTKLPKSNVLYFELENDSWCCVRPSATEPKIKFYVGVKGSSLEDANNCLQRVEKEILSLVEGE